MRAFFDDIVAAIKSVSNEIQEKIKFIYSKYFTK
jgi:hypothetical protein